MAESVGTAVTDIVNDSTVDPCRTATGIIGTIIDINVETGRIEIPVTARQQSFAVSHCSGGVEVFARVMSERMGSRRVDRSMTSGTGNIGGGHVSSMRAVNHRISMTRGAAQTIVISPEAVNASG